MKVKLRKLTMTCEVKIGPANKWSAAFRKRILEDPERTFAGIFERIKRQAIAEQREVCEYYPKIDAAFIVRLGLEPLDE